MTETDDEQAIKTDLEAALRALTGHDRLRLGPPLEPLAGGFDTETHAFRLDNAPDSLKGDLVLRLFRTAAESHRVRFDAMVQNMVADAGYPAPRNLIDTTGRLIAGRPFLIMQRVAGRSLLDSLVLDSPESVAACATLLGQSQAELHGLDATAALVVFRSAGFDPEDYTPARLLVRLGRLAEATGAPGLMRLRDWLAEHVPAPVTDITLCHGDFHPANVLVDGGQVAGVVDWSNVAFGRPEFDVAVTRLILSVGLAEALPEVAARTETSARFVGHYLSAYQAVRPIDLDLVNYYTVLRGGHALARVIAARDDASLPGAAHDRYPWSRPAIYAPVRSMISDATGIDIVAS